MCSKWRLRHELTRQLGSLGTLASSQEVQDVLLPLSLRFLKDPTAVVRQEAAAQVGSLLASVRDRTARGSLAQHFTEFAYSSFFYERQLFVTICREVRQTPRLLVCCKFNLGPKVRKAHD